MLLWGIMGVGRSLGYWLSKQILSKTQARKTSFLCGVTNVWALPALEVRPPLKLQFWKEQEHSKALPSGKPGHPGMKLVSRLGSRQEPD